MPRDRDAPAMTDRPAVPLMPLALCAAAVVAAILATQEAGLGAFAMVALVLVAAACTAAGTLWARQTDARRLHEARLQYQHLLQLTDGWVWQTDAQHRLVRLQPPGGAPASAWASHGGNGQYLWERFAEVTQPGSLGERMAAHAPLPDLAVRGNGDGGSHPEWTLRGLPRFDCSGVFCGYLGVARPATVPAGAAWASPVGQPAVQEASADEPLVDDPRALAAEYASFSYTVSHDLRAPIRVVEGFARILKEDYGHALDRIGNDHLDRVLSAAARMNHMIDALLSLSRLSTQPLQRQPVNLSQLALYILDDLRRTSPEREVDVRIEPDMTVQGDPTLLRMALENLLGNAWKYSAKVPRAVIAFERAQSGGRTAYMVRDNGAGFDMRFADRLFGVFQRLHSSGDFQGTGVGLASVRRIVRRHGGEIWAESEVGQGAQFYFTLGD